MASSTYNSLADSTTANRFANEEQSLSASDVMGERVTVSAESTSDVSFMDILTMTRSQLKNAVLKGRRPFNVPDAANRLDLMDRPTLERLAFLALRARCR